MKTRWKILIGVVAVGVAAIAAPIVYVETACGADGSNPRDAAYRSPLAAADHRAEVRSWLTYPEWHIVHSADSLGRHLSAGKTPSAYGYGADVASFWRSACAVNRVSAGRAGASDTKIMIYTIGISYSVEMAVKAAWENTVGRLFEWASGHQSADDKLAATVQQDYGAFMHQTPWYKFPFGDAFSKLWHTSEPDQTGRHWERRVALSMEYGVKAGYAALIDKASGAALGRDQLTLKFVTPSNADAVARLDPRFKSAGKTADGQTIVEAPRYAEFTDLLLKLAAAKVPVSDIAGNDDIFLTVVAPRGARLPGDTLFTMPLGDRPGWQRVGLDVKVTSLSATLPAIQQAGGKVEHVHDY